MVKESMATEAWGRQGLTSGLASQVSAIQRVPECVHVGIGATALYGIDGQEPGFSGIEGTRTEDNDVTGGVGNLRRQGMM